MVSSRVLVLFALYSTYFTTSCLALRCYETDENGRTQVTEEENANGRSSTFCVLTFDGPAYNNSTTSFRTSNAIEDVKIYKNMLSINPQLHNRHHHHRHSPEGAVKQPNYSILTACVIERYYINEAIVDYGLRCFCHHDYCNEQSDVVSYFRRTVQNDIKDRRRRIWRL